MPSEKLRRKGRGAFIPYGGALPYWDLTVIKGEGPAEEEGPRRILPWANHLPTVMIQGRPLAAVLQPSTLCPSLQMLRSSFPWGDVWKGTPKNHQRGHTGTSSLLPRISMPCHGQTGHVQRKLISLPLTVAPLASVPEGTEERGRKSNLTGISSKTWPGRNKCVF